MIWSNVGLSSSTYLGAAVLAWTLFALLAIFYLVPVGAVQALLQVDKLERFKFFKVIMDVSAPRLLSCQLAQTGTLLCLSL